MPVISSWANDVSYDKIFVEQLKNSLTKNEILIGFSGSGNSKNIINAYEYAKQTGATCIGFTGNDGGKMKECCDICLKIPSDDMLTIESQHLVVCHCIINLIRSLGNPLFEYK
jgi:D-sedoheptulose 7-phosphate isomerase